MWRTIRTQVARAAHQVPGSAEPPGAGADGRRPLAVVVPGLPHRVRRVPPRCSASGPPAPPATAGKPSACSTPPTCARPRSDHGDAAAVANCAALLGVPHWLRERHPALDFDQVLLRRAGITAAPKLRFLDPATMRRTMTEPLSAQPGWRPGQGRDG